ncbi:MAG: glycosyl hydrolase [bacterium]|nr:glycosyl hydrolase [bacterium]
MKRLFLIVLAFVLLFSFTYAAPKTATPKKGEKKKEKPLFSGLKFRSIGPAYTSGRISDFAVNPRNHSEIYVAVSCGHIWKTQNAGITWKPVFEKYGAYSIGCLTIDPTNPNVVWAGTGENNHQRALAYGDGIYKTVDGGKSWKNMGLKESRHIGGILVNPRNPDTVYVAAEGSAWAAGGDRGLYKTVDGGKSWKKVLDISKHTGINSIVMDPRNPDTIIAASEQRRRHVFTKIGGGPETGLHKTTDGGKTWRKLTSGLPSGHLGGIGLALSPVDPDVVYAIIGGNPDKRGFYRSRDRGESWSKMSAHASSGQYYNEIFCHPKDVDKVYSVETFTRVTVDGGKTFKAIKSKYRHVDDHALWIDPDDTNHLLIGGDGGIYETFDNCKNWRHVPNLPVTQFYRVYVDNTLPFYHVYGGTQDNNSMGGPSQNTSRPGVVSDEWTKTNGGDGFWGMVDPKNPDIVYSEAQYGWMVRFDKKSGERKYIRPQPAKNEKTHRWNWNTPLLISPHSHTRLYCAAEKVFRSDDRGDSWKTISDDLTAQIDRNTWPVMDKYWSVDAVAKDVSTSLYGTIVSLDESPLKEDLLYVGTDDGLIRTTENAGKEWNKIDTFPGVPANTYVTDLMADKFNEQVVYAAFDNRKRDDFTPYLLKSSDKGRTWKSIAGNLPKQGTVHTIAQDYIDRNLLFAGTEFGIFFSSDSGGKWTQLKTGIPTIAVRDIAIQQRENDLVLATFGRGFYILDDYSPLRHCSADTIKKEAHIFPIKDARLYIRTDGKSGRGASYYKAKNPPFGATFTYYLKDTYKTLKQIRQKKEKALFKKGERIPIPSNEELRREAKQISPFLLFTVTDEAGHVIREIRQKPKKGVNRMAWDLKYPDSRPLRMKKNKYNPVKNEPGGMLVMPGNYKVSLSKCIDGGVSQLVEPVPFTVKVLNNTTLPAKDRKALVAFQRKLAELMRVYFGISNYARALQQKVAKIKQTVVSLPGGAARYLADVKRVETKLDDLIFSLDGPRAKASREELPPMKVPLRDRLGALTRVQYYSTSAPGQTQLDMYRILEEEIPPVLQKLSDLVKVDIKALDMKLEKEGAPWTPDRLPTWKK